MASHNRTHASDRGKAVVDIPGIPTIGTATAGPESATVEFTANVLGGAATTFTALSNPGSITGTGSSSPVTVEGLTADTSYTFTVRGSNSTGTGEYSGVSNSVTPTVATSYESIATSTPTSGASVTFSSIPSTYKHLQVRFSVITTNATEIFGSLSGSSSYATHELGAYFGAGADRVGTNANTGQTGFKWIYGGMGQTIAGTHPTVGIIDIHDYTSTTKNKVIRSFVGANDNSSTNGGVNLSSGLSLSTTAVTSITLNLNAGSFSTGSTISLYGIKG